MSDRDDASATRTCRNGMPHWKIVGLFARTLSEKDAEAARHHTHSCEDCAAAFTRLHAICAASVETVRPSVVQRPLRRRLAWAASAAAVLVLVIFVSRSQWRRSRSSVDVARLSVAAGVPVDVFVDERGVGRAPIDGLTLTAGKHVVRASGGGLVADPIEVDVSGGIDRSVRLLLRGADAASLESLATATAALGIENPAPDVSGTRGSDREPTAFVVSPRGRTPAPAAEFSVWALDPIVGCQIELRTDQGPTLPPVATWKLDLKPGVTTVALSAEQAAELLVGATYTLIVRAGSSSVPGPDDIVSFTLAPAPDLARQEVERSLVPGDATTRLVWACKLLELGFAGDAFVWADRLDGQLPVRRKAVLAVQVVALERAGLKGTTLWAERFNAWEALER